MGLGVAPNRARLTAGQRDVITESTQTAFTRGAQSDLHRSGRRGRAGGVDFYVAIDFFLNETAHHADIVQPRSLHEEDEGVVTQIEGRLIKINKAADPPGKIGASFKTSPRRSPARTG